MTRIVKKPREEDIAKTSRIFDHKKTDNPELTLTQFCDLNKIPYQALRAYRANQVRLHGSNVIQHSRQKRQDMHPDSVLRLNEKRDAEDVDGSVKKTRKKRQKHVDVFDELDRAYATIGRLVVNGGKL